MLPLCWLEYDTCLECLLLALWDSLPSTFFFSLPLYAALNTCLRCLIWHVSSSSYDESRILRTCISSMLEYVVGYAFVFVRKRPVMSALRGLEGLVALDRFKTSLEPLGFEKLGAYVWQWTTWVCFDIWCLMPFWFAYDEAHFWGLGLTLQILLFCFIFAEMERLWTFLVCWHSRLGSWGFLMYGFRQFGTC